jgi:ectoine hydroxylase-related dioxygenase (phytanoyl-CoA dioxygenase family)
LVKPTLGPEAKPVRGTLFDKTPTANWKVPWHQDLTIAVNKKREIAGYGPWTVKAGVTQVQPPAAILAAILAVRIHLDPCDETNGALRVIPGTHQLGRLSPADIRRLNAGPPTLCPVPIGGAPIMHPTLLHASSPTSRPNIGESSILNTPPAPAP